MWWGERREPLILITLTPSLQEVPTLLAGVGVGHVPAPPSQFQQPLTPQQAFDDFIFAFFAVEMVVKMVALGIFGKKCYLGDTWNRLDFFIVIAG